VACTERAPNLEFAAFASETEVLAVRPGSTARRVGPPRGPRTACTEQRGQGSSRRFERAAASRHRACDEQVSAHEPAVITVATRVSWLEVAEQPATATAPGGASPKSSPRSPKRAFHFSPPAGRSVAWRSSAEVIRSLRSATRVGRASAAVQCLVEHRVVLVDPASIRGLLECRARRRRSPARSRRTTVCPRRRGEGDFVICSDRGYAEAAGVPIAPGGAGARVALNGHELVRRA
jgi:hypothetical protein